MTSCGDKLVIVHTNDIHSHFDNMPYVAGAIAACREKYANDSLLIMDLGDHVDRMTLETDSSDGLANVEVMNAAGYDLATLGNRELLTITHGRLGQLADQVAHYPVIVSNLTLLDTGEPPAWMQPYVIINRRVAGADCRIAIVGLTHYLPRFYEPLGWKMEDPLDAARRWADRLRPEADVLIVMSHLGSQMDRQLAEQGGIDFIVGAHSHDLIETPLCVNGTYIVQAGCYGQHIGVAEISCDPMRRKISAVHGYCTRTGDYAADEPTLQVIKKFRIHGERKFGDELVYLPEPLSMEWNKETALGNVLAAGVRRCTNAEIGIINAGQFVDGLAAGAVTRAHLLNACPSPARPCRVVLRGKDIWKALEDALNPEIVDKRIGGFGFSGKFVGTLCLDGAKVEYDSSKPGGDKIVAVWIQGSLLEAEREYAVGTVDAFASGVGYTSLGQSDDLSFPYTGLMREVLATALADADIVKDSAEPRWRDIFTK